MATAADRGRFGSAKDYHGFVDETLRHGMAAFISRWTAEPIKPERVALEYSSGALAEAVSRLDAIAVALEGDGDIAGALRAFCEAYVDGEIELSEARYEGAADMRLFIELAGELLVKRILRARGKERGAALSELGAITYAPESRAASA